MTINEIIAKIQTNKENHEHEYYNCLPFEMYPRFQHFVPGIVQGRSYMLTGNSGCGKSKLSRTLFIHQPYQYIKAHPELGIELSVIYFSLEEDKERIYMSELSRNLRTKFNISVSIDQLLSIGKDNTISRDLFPKIDACREELEMFMNKVQVYDNIANPTGVYKTIRDEAYRLGRYTSKTGTLFSAAEMEEIKLSPSDSVLFKNINGFQYINPRTYIIAIVDHIGLTKPEKLLTLHQAISKLSSEYLLDGKNKLHITPVVVQQQTHDKESMEYTARGTTIEEKLEPSLDGLGENKVIQRDFETILGVFQPARYNIKKHLNYDISRIGDNYRSLSVLKNRNGLANKKLPLLFDGVSDYFAELPIITSPEQSEVIYKKIEEILKK